MIPFSRFSDLLPAFTCTGAISNLLSICLGVNILICVAKSEGTHLPFLLLYLYVIKVKDFFNNIDYFFSMFIFRNFLYINIVS